MTKMLDGYGVLCADDLDDENFATYIKCTIITLYIFSS